MSGVVESIVFRNEENGYTVLDLATDEELVTAVGQMADVREGEGLLLHGCFQENARFGRQFSVAGYEVRLPESAEGIRRYLAGGALPYIRAALAKRIVEEFGGDTLEVIATQPARLAKIKGITPEKAREIQSEFKRLYGAREAIAYLATLGVSTAAALALFRHYGPDTSDIVAANPYVLCNYPAYLPFEAADRIAGDMSLEFDSHERMCAGILHVLRHNLQNGHACLPEKQLVATAAAFLRIEPENIASTLTQMLDSEAVCTAAVGEKEYVYLPDLARAERYIAGHMRDLLSIPVGDARDADRLINRLELINQIRYAPLQREAIAAALSHRALVLTGGPGTGKTTTVNGILAAFEQNGERVALAAPTGRAAKRLSELTGRKATTIHRLLEVERGVEESVRFLHNEKNQLKCDVVIIDEMSMVDSLLFESLLLALKPQCRIVMVGDEDQLPSVGAGNVLGSMMASGVVPTVRLTEIFRQAAQSGIVENAHRIIAGEPLHLAGRESDFFLLERQDPNVCAELVCSLVCQRLPQSYGFDPTEDIQVLCPTKIGPLGTVALNTLLQERLNPPAPGKAQLSLRDRVLRVGDKVMQIKNNYDIPFTRPNGGEEGAGAFNGDMGIIEEIDAAGGTVTVRSEDRRLVYTSEHIRELEPAYAVTIHKSQGSEYPAIVMPLLDVPPRLCYRNLLYTGVTRARKLCVLTGRQAEATGMIANVRNNKRFSCLASFLNGEAT